MFPLIQLVYELTFGEEQCPLKIQMNYMLGVFSIREIH
jgi:hypothetical protein